jgi:hypothetical protein
MSKLRQLAARVRARLRAELARHLEEPGPPPVPPAPLRVELDGSWVLDGLPVAEGEAVELLLPGGRFLPAQLRREPGGWPAVWVTLGGPWEFDNNGRRLRRPHLAARVSHDARLRRAS